MSNHCQDQWYFNIFHPLVFPGNRARVIIGCWFFSISCSTSCMYSTFLTVLINYRFLLLLAANGRWSVPETQSAAAKPEARMGHSAIFDPKLRTVYVFGGSKNKKWFSDIQTVDTDTWQLLCVQVCCSALCIYLVSGHECILIFFYFLCLAAS
jgi:hypothetical protein